MKTIKILTAFIGLLLLTTFSCEEKLDLPPLGELNSETFYITYDDFEAASLAPYSTLLNFYYNQSGLGHYRGIEYPSDDARHGGQGVNSNVDFVWLPDNGDFSFLYTESYKGVMRANTILNRLPASELTQQQKDRFEGEARFIRAYFYFLLARHWGTPPLIPDIITSLENTNQGNSQPGEVIEFVKQDLIEAKQKLPATWDADNTGRATSGAAAALLGKVYLYQEEYQEAASEFEMVIAGGQYALVDNFEENFSEDHQNNPESIFEIQFSRGNFNPWLPVDFGLAGNQNIGHAGTARAINFRASCFLGKLCPRR
jgi:starch-binding outer membrane protein, SusD/RagB family